ncbi:glycoside hydrolase family 95 protein-like protein [Ampelomyces quisqualis]|uniref:Glycoside hydrolase family 95 protein-like protein n=1 Tax=Ampelomyces quisqualis TaxID=50730 RepID=A0A6A5QNY5_AMPQU|nr:glycoside hydrolase family 95 protein-like protein [Ampelomyces quisqualis]
MSTTKGKARRLCSSLAFASVSLADANQLLWSSSPAQANEIIRTTYPIGNGRLAAMPFGPAGSETLTLNIDSLWSGGPFEVNNYTGGNPTSSVASALPGIRDWIFTNGTGNVSELLGSNDFYGSYRVLGNLSITIPSIRNGNISTFNYSRALNIGNGIHTQKFSTNTSDFETSVFCSYPDQVCVYTVQASRQLPLLEVRLNNDLVEPVLHNLSCEADHVRMRGLTQLGPPEGMLYDSIARVLTSNGVKTSCNNETSILTIRPSSGTKAVSIVVGAETNYDATRGTAEFGYSFKGHDPGPAIEASTHKAARMSLEAIKSAHIEDFMALTGRFELSLPDTLGSAHTETAELISRYDIASEAGDPYLENLIFNYANYLFISSSRSGSLPPNLQGRWSEGLGAAWSADYHANINVQMNHWTPDQTGLTDLQTPLWDYMANNWVPRGSETAELLYGAPGWVVHNEINVFGHTGMKSDASWANYPAAAAWMMQHVFDHWDYSRDVAWLKVQGYPLIKGVARFWLSQLQEDTYTKDGTLVVNPCNSPEHGKTTFGCAHYQQLIHQVFEAVLSIRSIVDEADDAFVTDILSSLKRLDKGFHVGAWGQIKEWKLPDSEGYEFINDTHRHLSELTGWYPGYSLSSFLGGYSNSTIQDAVRQKLYSRGEGKGEDANAGWAKVWRSACWARLNDTERAYFELRYSISENVAGNGFSMYSGTNTPFQIDANFGFGGAVLSMLIVDLPSVFGDDSTRTVILGPAIPAAWANGKARGLRLRGGGTVDFLWNQQGLVTHAQVQNRSVPIRLVDKNGLVLAEV